MTAYSNIQIQTHNLYCKKNQPSDINIHVNSPCRNKVKLHKNENNLQMQTTAWSYMGFRKNNNKWYAYTVSILYTHIWTSFTTTENSKLYNISAIRTVAQNTILIYSNTFFLFYNVQVQTVHTIKCKAQAPKRPQKCMLPGQLEATGREDWHESADESCQYRTGASPHFQPQCLARLIVSGGKSGVDINYTCRHTWLQMHTRTHTRLNIVGSSRWKWPTC